MPDPTPPAAEASDGRARGGPPHGWMLPAAAAFSLSFFLPAVSEGSGFSCLRDCWRVLVRSDRDHALPLGWTLYFAGFVAANALFVVLWGALLRPLPCRRLRLLACVAALLQVLSWLVVYSLSVWHGDQFELHAGYFLWLLSFFLLLGAHLFHGPRGGPPVQVPGESPVAPGPWQA